MAALLSSSRMGRCSHLNWTCAKSGKRSPRSLPTAELLGAGGIMDVDNGRHTGSLNSQFPKTVPDGWCIKKMLFFFSPGRVQMCLREQASGSMSQCAGRASVWFWKRIPDLFCSTQLCGQKLGEAWVYPAVQVHTLVHRGVGINMMSAV